MKCDNCAGAFDLVMAPAPKDNGIIIRQGNHVVASVCSKCTDSVHLAKMTMRRTAGTGAFLYEQYQPVEAGKRFGG